jgi:hypothetical protein
MMPELASVPFSQIQLDKNQGYYGPQVTTEKLQQAREGKAPRIVVVRDGDTYKPVDGLDGFAVYQELARIEPSHPVLNTVDVIIWEKCFDHQFIAVSTTGVALYIYPRWEDVAPWHQFLAEIEGKYEGLLSLQYVGTNTKFNMYQV